MELDEVRDDREAEAETALRSLDRLRRLDERLEDHLQHRRIDADAVVGDRELRAITDAATAHDDPTVARRILRGVRQ